MSSEVLDDGVFVYDASAEVVALDVRAIGDGASEKVDRFSWMNIEGAEAPRECDRGLEGSWCDGECAVGIEPSNHPQQNVKGVVFRHLGNLQHAKAGKESGRLVLKDGQSFRRAFGENSNLSATEMGFEKVSDVGIGVRRSSGVDQGRQIVDEQEILPRRELIDHLGDPVFPGADHTHAGDQTVRVDAPYVMSIREGRARRDPPMNDLMDDRRFSHAGGAHEQHAGAGA
ncbi:MAG: hypothetical protein AAGK78_11535, partial [Planctomycetota bacterium]